MPTRIETTHEELTDTVDALADMFDIDLDKIKNKLSRFDTTGELHIKSKPTKPDKKAVAFHIIIT